MSRAPYPQARRDHHETIRDQLLAILLGRCEATLAATLPDGRALKAAYSRDEVLGRLGELFAEDGTGDNPDELDYFEVRFNATLAALRIDLVREEVRALRRSSPLPDDETIARRPDDVLHSAATQENGLFLNQLFHEIYSLPHEERDAVVLDEDGNHCTLHALPEQFRVPYRTIGTGLGLPVDPVPGPAEAEIRF